MENQEIKINFSDIKTMKEYREYIRQTSAAWYQRNKEYKKQELSIMIYWLYNIWCG